MMDGPFRAASKNLPAPYLRGFVAAEAAYQQSEPIEPFERLLFSLLTLNLLAS